MQIAPRVLFHPDECPHCQHYLAQGQRCRAFAVESWLSSLLAVLAGDSREPCPRFSKVASPAPGFSVIAPPEPRAPVVSSSVTDASLAAPPTAGAPMDRSLSSPSLQDTSAIKLTAVSAKESSHAKKGEAAIPMTTQEREAGKICPRCKTQLQMRDRACQTCGARFAVSVKGYCPSCKTIVQVSGARRCSRCGGEVSEARYESRYLETAAIPATKTMPVNQTDQARLHCPKCQAPNPTNERRCQKCGANLLPAESALTRLGFLLGGILGGALAGGLAYLKVLYEKQFSICPSPLYFAGAALFIPIIGLAMALRRTPRHVRYENRAKRHLQLSPLQAVADFSQALLLAPEKEIAGLLKQRAAVYDKLGMQKDAMRDMLAYSSAPGAMAEEALLVKMFGGDTETYLSSRRDNLQEGFVSSGKAKVVGYCSKCRLAVELTADKRCLVHTRQKGKKWRLVLADEMEAGKQAVMKELQQERRARRWNLVRYIFALALAALAIIYLLTNL